MVRRLEGLYSNLSIPVGRCVFYMELSRIQRYHRWSFRCHMKKTCAMRQAGLREWLSWSRTRPCGAVAMGKIAIIFSAKTGCGFRVSFSCENGVPKLANGSRPSNLNMQLLNFQVNY